MQEKPEAQHPEMHLLAATLDSHARKA